MLYSCTNMATVVIEGLIIGLWITHPGLLSQPEAFSAAYLRQLFTSELPPGSAQW